MTSCNIEENETLTIHQDAFIFNASTNPCTPGLHEDTYKLYVQKLNEKLALTRFIVQKILVPAVVLFGVCGNVVNTIVLTRRCVLIYRS